MDEYSLWKKIFETDDDLELKELLRLVVFDYDARDLVFKKLLYLKNLPNEMVNININIDKSLSDFPNEKLIEKISDDIMKQLVKKDLV